jgi:uncharacterized protein (TIGR03086 family)
MTQLDVQLTNHRKAQEIFQDVLAEVGEAQMGLPTPCPGWTVADLVDHVIGGNGWVQSLAGRQPAPAPADNKRVATVLSAAGAQDVFAAEDGLTRMFELPFGTMPGAAFIGLRTSDVYMHAWDLAKATGQSTDLDPELGAETLTATQMRITDAFRGEGRPFGAQQPCPEGRPVADQLAAFLGRCVD